MNIAGYPAGSGDCTADYTISAAESPNPVALQVIEHRHGDPNANCATSATLRQATVTLKSLVGERVVIDAATDKPVIVTGAAS